MGVLVDFIVGFLRGGLFVTILVIVLFTLANLAFGDETVATRPATLGEQDRSLNYKYTDSDAGESEHTVTIVVEDESKDDVLDCAATNARLQAAKDTVEKHVKDSPKYGFLYDDVLELIEEKWCHDNDN